MASDQWDGVPGLLPEDSNERQIFNSAAGQLGSPLLAVWSQLNTASVMAPEQGSWGRYLAVMANEVRAAIIAEADLAARVEAERVACEKAVSAVFDRYRKMGDTTSEIMAAGVVMAEASIRALGPTPAYDAAIKAARREGSEEVFTALEERHAMYLSEVERWAAKGIHNAANLSRAKASTIRKAINAIRAAAGGGE